MHGLHRFPADAGPEAYASLPAADPHHVPVRIRSRRKRERLDQKALDETAAAMQITGRQPVQHFRGMTPEERAEQDQTNNGEPVRHLPEDQDPPGLDHADLDDVPFSVYGIPGKP
jgi:hypothetical protein